MILSPLKPTWQRYFYLFWQCRNITIFRALEYETLECLSYGGRILDFGGGKRAHYYSRLMSWIKGGTYEAANIDPAMEPTYVTDQSNKLPVEDSIYDMVLSFNTFEYMYDAEDALRELVRVLRPGGRLIVAAPFLYRVHGAADLQRQTANWWEMALAKTNIQQTEITPLAWDYMTAGLSVTEGGGPLCLLRRLLVPLYGLFYSCIRSCSEDGRYSGAVAEVVTNMALGYVITGVKGA